MQSTFIDITILNKENWNKSLYKNFLNSCNQKEFLQSQVPFFHAVESFPRMLLQLASMIHTSEERLLVIENLWEEHGNGDTNTFHTTTFKEHLYALGFNKDDDEYIKNPYVSDWIDGILNMGMDLEDMGTYLAGVEYMYAVISEDISDYILSLQLDKPSPHYHKHAELDWDHGHELLDVVLGCGGDINKDIFKQAQLDFIQMFDKLTILTEKELKNVAKMPVSFYYIREDSNIEIEAIKTLNQTDVKVFSVCSGGEHILEMINNKDKLFFIDLIDVNDAQLDVFKNKLSSNYINTKGEGKFEYLFSFLKTMLFMEDCAHDKHYILENLDKLKYLTNIVFSRENLNIVFTENATKYSSSNFADHFFNAFIDSLISDNINAQNIFFDTPILNNQNYDSNKNYKISYEVSDIDCYDFKCRYDVINLSNVGDWMPTEEFACIIKKAQEALNDGGILIVRKLLGDYSLKGMLSGFSEVTNHLDNTHFYSECCVARK